jgi:hypothetical protein
METDAMHASHVGHPLVEAFQRHRRSHRAKNLIALTAITLDLVILLAVILH